MGSFRYRLHLLALLLGGVCSLGVGGLGEKPDISFGSVGGAPTSLLPGETLLVSLDLTNLNEVNTTDSYGTQPWAGYHQVAVFLSADDTITTADEWLGTLGALGTQTTSPVDLVIPKGIPAGTYRLGFIADVASQVTEANENNNIALGPTITVLPSPDIVSGGHHGFCQPDGQLRLFGSLVNSGAAAAGAFQLGFYGSLDDTIDLGDVRLGGIAYSNLSPGQLDSYTPVVLDVSTVPPGRYRLGALLDELDQVAEVFNDNNAFAGNYIDLPCPVGQADLAVTNLAGACNADGTLAVSGVLQNLGTVAAVGPFEIGLYGSADGVIDPSDERVGLVAVNGTLDAGFQANFAGDIAPLTANLPAGSYTFGALADDLYSVGESDESNNAAVAGTIDLPCTKPDLTVTTLTTSCNASGFIDIAASVQNTGSTAAAPFRVAVYADPQSGFDLTPRRLMEFNFASGQPAGTEVQVTHSLLFIDLPRQPYVLRAVADDLSDVTETNESNNELSAASAIELPCPALGPCAGQAQGVECRAAASECDAPEVCDGLSFSCPPDEPQPFAYLCGGPLESCLVPDACDGAGTCVIGGDQPYAVDLIASADTVLDGGSIGYTLTVTNGSGLVSAIADATVALPATATFAGSPDGCTAGLNSVICPLPLLAAGESVTFGFAVDVAVGGGGSVTAEVSVCGQTAQATTAVEEPGVCDLFGAGFSCRPAATECDVAEVCAASTGDCPADLFQAPGVPCGDYDLECRFDALCDGTGLCASGTAEPFAVSMTAGPNPVVASTALTYDTTVTNLTAMASNPTSLLIALPAEVTLASSATGCSAVLGGASCPVEPLAPGAQSVHQFTANVAASVTEPIVATAGLCGASAVATTTVEPPGICTGQPAGTECRPAASDCDVAEACNGVSDDCPADAFRAAGVACAPGATACQEGSICDGGGSCLPGIEQPFGLVLSGGGATVTAGGILEYSAKITNTGTANSAITEASIALPEAVTFSEAVVLGQLPTCSLGAANTVTCSVPFMEPGVTVTMLVKGELAADAPATITAEATLCSTTITVTSNVEPPAKGQLYGVRQGTVSALNRTSGVVESAVGTIGFGSNRGMATDPTSGLAYIIDNTGALYHFDVNTGTTTHVGPLTQKFRDLTFDAQGQLYGVTGNGAFFPGALTNTIFHINKATGEATEPWPVSIAGLGGHALGFDPLEPAVLFHLSAGSVFERVDLATGALEPIPTSGEFSVSARGMVWDRIDRVFRFFDTKTGQFGDFWTLTKDGVRTRISSGTGEFGVAFDLVTTLPLEVAIEATDGQAVEASNDGGQFLVRLVDADGVPALTDVPVVVSLAVTGSATAGVDYGPLPTEVIIPAGQGTATIAVDTSADIPGELEGEELIVVMITAVQGAVAAAENTATVVITEEDAMDFSVSVVASDPQATEGSSNLGAFTLTLRDSAGTPVAAPQDLGVIIGLGGTAQEGGDYAVIGTLATIAVGTSEVTIAVQPNADPIGILEGDETVVLTALGVEGGISVGEPASATVVVADSTTATATLSTLSDGAEAGPVDFVFEVSLDRANETGSTIAFDTALTGGDAVAGLDFVDTTGPQSLVIAPGAQSGTLALPVINDEVVEPAKTVELTLSNPSLALVSVGTGSATASLTDDDVGAPFTLLSMSPNASEPGATRVVTIVGEGLAEPVDVSVESGSTLAVGLEDATTLIATIVAPSAPGNYGVTVHSSGTAQLVPGGFQVVADGCPGGICGPCTVDAECIDGATCTGDTCVAGNCEHEATDPLCCDPVLGCDACADGGDLNQNGESNVVDIQCALVTLLWWQTDAIESAPTCLLAPLQVTDVNCDSDLTVSDIQILNLTVLGAPLPDIIDADSDGCADACQ